MYTVQDYASVFYYNNVIQVGVKQQSHTHSPNPHIQLDEQHCCNRTLRHNLELYTYIDVNQSIIR
jgi:hypothetical protein